MLLLEIQSSFRKCLDVQANTTRNRFCKANISYMANGQVLRIACRQSQRSVCFVKQFATMCAIHGDCYNVCYNVEFATLCVICELCCVIHGICYNVRYTWTLLQCVLYVDFQNQFATICVLCVLCEHQSFETMCFIISTSI